MQRAAKTLEFKSVGGVELQHGRSIGSGFQVHLHEEYQIMVMRAGALNLSVKERQHRVAPPAICVVNAGEPHAGAPVGWGWECLVFYVPAGLVAGWSTTRGAPCFSTIIEDDALAAELAAAHGDARGAGPAAQERLFAALSALTRAHAREPAPDFIRARMHRGVERALEYLQLRYVEGAAIAELAALARLSPYHFVRVFARDVGLTPHAYQCQLRMALAKRRLREGASAALAASESGYYDQSHFIRALRRSHGLTPAMFKRAVANRNFVQ